MMSVFQRAGIKYAVLTTRHTSGFCLWDSKYTKFDVAESRFRQDVDFYTSIRLAEITGYRIPEKLVVLGVRIKQQLVASQVPSPWILKKYSQMIEQISTIIRQVSI